jgi:uncharacterized YigZ family protein
VTLETISGFCTLQEEEKKSRFVCSAAPASSPEEANSFFEQVRDPVASHNAWAFKVGPLCRCSDDGEVSGTAGKPILGALEKQGLDQLAVMVTRYYGGIRLGTGGLVRAYGGVAARCLQNAPKSPIRCWQQWLLKIPFRSMGRVLDLLKRSEVEVLEKNPDAQGFALRIRCDAAHDEKLRGSLQNILGGIPDLREIEGD